MRCLKSRFPIWIIVFDELELIIYVSQGLTLSTASLVPPCIARKRISWCDVAQGFKFKYFSDKKKKLVVRYEGVHTCNTIRPVQFSELLLRKAQQIQGMSNVQFIPYT